MIISIRDKNVRKAVYRAFKGQCFYTGRPVREEEMVIDHLIPVSKGGRDSFENYVLTFGDLNAGKSNKLNAQLERMAWTVKDIYAPRAEKLYKKFSSNIKSDFKLFIDDEEVDFKLEKFSSRTKPPQNLFHLKTEHLFWVKDNGINIYSTQNCGYNKIFESFVFLREDIDEFEEYEKGLFINTSPNVEQIKSLKSLWYEVCGCFFRPILKIEEMNNSFYRLSNIYFSKKYITFLKWRKETADVLEAIFETENENVYEKALGLFCSIYPQPDYKVSNAQQNQPDEDSSAF